ncbi:MAG: hypothetical protein ACKVT2_14810 [Saprospiraceae bacterium]
MRTNFAYYLIAPFALLLLICLYLAWEGDEQYAIWAVPNLVIGSLLLVLSPQVNWWWYARNPPQLEPLVQKLLQMQVPFYQSLDPKDQKRFRDRVALVRMATDFSPMGLAEEKIPSDLQSAVSAQWVMVSWGSEGLLIPKYEKVILSPAGFMSPEHPFTHNSELFEKDQCLILSAEAVMAAFMKPDAFFQVALYEYARLFDRIKGIALPISDEVATWQALEQVAGYTRAQIEGVIGIPESDLKAVAVHHFFQYRERFRVVLPEMAGALEVLFDAH